MAKKKIVDRFSKLPVSRQRKYEMRLIAKGLCPRCRNPLGEYSSMCAKCLEKKRGFKRWKRGKVGRPPNNRKR